MIFASHSLAIRVQSEKKVAKKFILADYGLNHKKADRRRGLIITSIVESMKREGSYRYKRGWEISLLIIV